MLASFALSSAAQATTGTFLPVLEKVMTGQSSSGSDQVWGRVEGQPANVPADCVYSSWSLFHVDDDTAIGRDRALSLLLTAKTANLPVHIEFDVLATAADFWGWGISKCVIRRVIVG